MSVHLLPRLAIDRWPLIPLRLIVGYGFMEHGFAKLAKDLLDGWTKPAPDMSSAVRKTVAFRPSRRKAGDYDLRVTHRFRLCAILAPCRRPIL